MTIAVSEIPAADPAETLERLQSRLRFETDCWDVHEGLRSPNPDFVLVDVRSRDAYERGHVAGAVSLPHRTITRETLRGYAPDTLFVTYCDGPHCNGSTRGAIALAALGYRVKEMIGGVTGWRDEGFELEVGAAEPAAAVTCGC
ncbi:MAG TPA: rhodanese-like domain-containing protein [Thermoanaerobaculia bacterium]